MAFLRTLAQLCWRPSFWSFPKRPAWEANSLRLRVGSSYQTKGMRTVGCPLTSESQCGPAATGSRLFFQLLLPPALGCVPLPQFPPELSCSLCHAGSLDLPVATVILCHCLDYCLFSPWTLCLLLTRFAFSLDTNSSCGSVSDESFPDDFLLQLSASSL